MGRLTTHVLDAAHGCPGSDIRIELYRVEGERLELVTTSQTNSDGRCDSPLLEGDDYRSGVYPLQFAGGSRAAQKSSLGIAASKLAACVK